MLKNEWISSNLAVFKRMSKVTAFMSKSAATCRKYYLKLTINIYLWRFSLKMPYNKLFFLVI